MNTSHAWAELRLGPTWEQNPPVYLNFVKWVVQKHELVRANHPRTMQVILQELHAYNLTIEGNKVQGSLEDLTAWQLAHA